MEVSSKQSFIDRWKSRIFTSGRKPWIDLLRAIAIAFVIFGHHLPTSLDNRFIYFVFTSPIKLPLFFAISGYLFSADRYNPGQFLLKLLRQLVIPWIVLGLLGSAMQTVFAGSSFIGSAKALFTGKSFWYMPCLIIAEIIFYFIVRYIKKIWAVILLCAACFAIGHILYQQDTLDILMINRALCVQAFLVIGYLIRVFWDRICEVDIKAIVVLALIYIGLGVLSVFVFPGCDMDVHMCDYYCIPLNFAMVVIGVVTLFAGFSKLQKIPKWISFIGQNTLLAYMLNAYPVSVFTKVLAAIGIVIPSGVGSAFIYLIVALIGCSVISMIVNYIAPEIVGRKRK